MAETIASSGSQGPLVQIKGLTKHFPVTKGAVLQRVVGQVKAVNGVSFSISRGEALGLVGESGCGKTTIARCILKLEAPTDGEILFDGRNIEQLDKKTTRVFRRRVQAIFQDPYSSLNPRMKVGEIIGEPLIIHGVAQGRADLDRRVQELLDLCGLTSGLADRYPHEMSGGQRQRVGIARALALRPEFIVCDEAVSALDVSIQAQIINLLQDLQNEYGITLLFIAHDLSVIKHISDRVAVMYLGKIVEMASKTDLFDQPEHPYTQALLCAIPVPDPGRRKKGNILMGDVPSPVNPPPGCRLHPRCPRRMDICSRQIPDLKEHSPRHFAACHLYS